MTLWTQDPKAQALLAELVENPPSRHTFTYSHGDTETRYASGPGGPVARLRGVRERALEAIWFLEKDSDNFFANADLTVDAAIDQAIEEASVRRAA